MANSSFTVELTANGLPEFRGALRRKLARALDKIALDVEAGAKTRAPVDTGALRNSIQAKQVGSEKLLREVAVGVEYGAFVEFGTRHMAARPYLQPAVEAQRGVFDRVVGQAVEEAAREAEV